MNLKKILLAFFALLLFFPLVFGLEFEFDNLRAQKGQSFQVSGYSDGFTRIEVRGQEGGKEIFVGSVRPDSNGFFSALIETSCLDPVGYWDILMEDQSGAKEVGLLFVEPSYECGFYSVAFTSPSPSKYGRKSSFDITVKVEDNRVPVRNAMVYFWDLKGKKKAMNPIGNGIYSFNGFEIPFDAPLGQWKLTVTASKKVGSKYFGGESTVLLDIDRVSLGIELIEPKIREFQFGSPINLKIRPFYLDGTEVGEAVVEVEFKEEKHKAKKAKDGSYVFLIPSDGIGNELVSFTISATDSAGNSGSKRIVLTPVGYWAYLIQSNALFYIFPLIFLAYVLFLSLREVKSFLSKAGLKRRKKKLVILLKRLQEDYFHNQVVSSKLYREQSENYAAEIDEIDSKLIELDKKQKIR